MKVCHYITATSDGQSAAAWGTNQHEALAEARQQRFDVIVIGGPFRWRWIAKALVCWLRMFPKGVVAAVYNKIRSGQ